MKQTTQKVSMSQSGFCKLTKEVDRLENNLRPDAIERLSEARANGDLTDYSEYQSAEENLVMLDKRIQEDKDLLTRVVVVNAPKNKASRIGLGSSVQVRANGVDREFIVVGEWEADPNNKKIGEDSPLGKAIMGKEKGSTVDVEAPTGVVTYYIKEVK